MKREISNRQDIELLVQSFYKLVRADEMLGPIFNRMIPDSNWPAHLEKLSDFWETILFATPKFHGNPVAAHRRVDASHEHAIDQKHFAHWLHLWFKTVDDLFSGAQALSAKNNARKMATGVFLSIWSGRPENVAAAV